MNDLISNLYDLLDDLAERLLLNIQAGNADIYDTIDEYKLQMKTIIDNDILSGLIDEEEDNG